MFYSPAGVRADDGLQALLAKPSQELERLYRQASVPASMHVADGELIGHMLAVRGVSGILAAPIRRLAASDSFLWQGKTMRATSDKQGQGHNRLYVPGVLGQQNLFPFETSFEPSALDGKPALALNYNQDKNPSYIRHIHDEVRELTKGVFFGPAMWKTSIKPGEEHSRKKLLLLWFAIMERPS